MMARLVLAFVVLVQAVAFAQPADRIRGRVVDAETGAPIGGAHIAAAIRTLARTDAEGRFEIARADVIGLVEIIKGGYQQQRLTAASLSPAEIEIRLAPAATLALYVLDQSGAPAIGWPVRILCEGGSGGNLVTDDTGYARTAYVWPGRCIPAVRCRPTR